MCIVHACTVTKINSKPMDSLIKITSVYAEITKTDYEMKMSNLLSICEHERALYGIKCVLRIF